VHVAERCESPVAYDSPAEEKEEEENPHSSSRRTAAFKEAKKEGNSTLL